MEQLLVKLLSKLATLPQRMRILVLIAGCVIIWFLWDSVLDAPLQTKVTENADKVQTLSIQVQQIENRLRGIEAQNTPAAIKTALQQRDGLLKQLAEINAKTVAFSNQQLSPDQVMKTVKALLLEEPGLTLKSAENGAPIPINPAGVKTEKPLLYQHNIIIEFSGSYFATLHYLQRLEKLPWRLYSDALDYQVQQYPQAKVTLHLHTLSPQENLLHA
jgi:MSHA biogenesis protein MshJ